MEHLLNYTFEWQSLIFGAVVAIVLAVTGLLNRFKNDYKMRFQNVATYKYHRYHLHHRLTFWVMFALTVGASFFDVFHVQYAPLIAAMYGGLILGAIGNYIRERIVMSKTGKNAAGDWLNEVDLNDVRHGAIGGMEGTVAGLIVVLIMFFIG